MTTKKLNRTKKILISFLILLFVSTILLTIQILLINMNGPYHGNWLKKYIYFLKDTSINPRRKSLLLLFIISAVETLYFYAKFLIYKFKSRKIK